MIPQLWPAVIGKSSGNLKPNLESMVSLSIALSAPRHSQIGCAGARWRQCNPCTFGIACRMREGGLPLWRRALPQSSGVMAQARKRTRWTVTNHHVVVLFLRLFRFLSCLQHACVTQNCFGMTMSTHSPIDCEAMKIRSLQCLEDSYNCTPLSSKLHIPLAFGWTEKKSTNFQSRQSALAPNLGSRQCAVTIFT